MIALLLASVAWGAEPWAWEETSVAVQPDLAGNLQVPIWQTLWASRAFESVRVEGYVELGWPSGVDQAVVARLYGLTADGQSGPIDWTLGRQRMEMPGYPRILDGGHAVWHASPTLSVEGWFGWAENAVLPIETGALFGRAALVLRVPTVRAEVGGWMESVATGGIIVHPYISGHWENELWQVNPSIQVISALAIGEQGTVLERARIDLSARPLSGTRAVIFVDHRDVLDASSVLAGGILATLAPQGTDEIGGGAGWSTVGRDELWAEGSLVAWDAADPDASPLAGADTGQLGYQASAAWRPSCRSESWCFSPSWRVASGGGGMFHAVGGMLTLPLPSGMQLGVHDYLVPWHTASSPWTLAQVGGVNLSLSPTPWMRWTIAGEAGHGLVAGVDYRGWSTLRMVVP